MGGAENQSHESTELAMLEPRLARARARAMTRRRELEAHARVLIITISVGVFVSLMVALSHWKRIVGATVAILAGAIIFISAIVAIDLFQLAGVLGIYHSLAS